MSAQTAPERMDSSDHLPNPQMDGRAAHQVPGSRCPRSSDMAYRFEALQEPLSRFSPLQATTVPQSIACRHVATLDGLGRLPTCAVQARPDVESAWTRGRHGFDVRLVVIGHDLVRNHASSLDRLAEEGLGAGRVAVVTKEHIHDHTVLINGPIQVALLSLAKQEHLVHEPLLADWASTAPHLGCELRPERLDPIEDSPVRDVDAALG